MQNLAIGRKAYVENIEKALGIIRRRKSVVEGNGAHALKEPIRLDQLLDCINAWSSNR